MSGKEFEIKPVWLTPNVGGQTAKPLASELSMADAFAPLAAAIRAVTDVTPGKHAAIAVTPALAASVDDFLLLAISLDAQYGEDSELPIADASTAVDQALSCLAELETCLDALNLVNQRTTLHTTILRIGYWAMRHRVTISAAGPIVNALAERANGAVSRQEAAATYALMQGFIAHFKPYLGADLERSNPERPWRLLNLNFAITAIRTGDPAMIRFAFSSLDSHLPDESAGFYAEARTLACQPGFPDETRALIEEAQLAKPAGWTQLH